MHPSFHKLLTLLVLLIAYRAQAFFPEHVWGVGSPTNSYGLAQWDESDMLGGVRGQKRTVIYFGSHQWVVRQPALLVIGLGAVGVLSLSLLGLASSRSMKNGSAKESAAGKRGIRVLFHAGRTCPALPECHRSA